MPNLISKPDQPSGEFQASDSPVLQGLVRAWADYHDGRIEADVLDQLFDSVDELVQVQLRELNAAEEEGSFLADEPHKMALLNSYQDHLLVTELMRQALSLEDDWMLEEAFIVLQDATHGLNRALAGLIKSEAAAEARQCPRCASENGCSSTRCRRCGTSLPFLSTPSPKSFSTVDTAQDEPGQTTPNFKRVAESKFAWSEQKIDSTGFESELLAVIENLLVELESLDSQQTRTTLLQETVNLVESSVRCLEQMVHSLRYQRNGTLELAYRELGHHTAKLVALQNS